MKNKKLIWIGVASALLIGGGIFWWWKSRNPSDSSDDTSKDETKETKETKDDTKTDTSTSGGGSSTLSNPLGDSSAVKAFQDWLDVKHPNWLNGGRLNKGSGYGNFGSNTKRAFDNYGSEYKSGSTTSSPSSSGFRAGNKLYTKKGVVNVYKYPDNVSKNRLGFIVQSANSQATFKADANTKGYIVAVTRYKTPDGKNEVIGDTYILASEVTNVAP